MAGQFRCFTRTWWKRNPAWPGGREPSLGQPRTIGWADSEEEARAICKRYNATHAPGPLSRKAEFNDESEGGMR